MEVGFLFRILQRYFKCFKILKIIKKKLLVFLFRILEGQFKCFKIVKIIIKKVTSISV
jgi:hypothetical protein